jgi:hypothetical protein
MGTSRPAGRGDGYATASGRFRVRIMDIQAWRGLVLLGSALVLFGCASASVVSAGKAETLIDRAGIDIIASDAGRRLTFIKERNATERQCLAPGPDFSRTAGGGLSLGLPTPAGGAVGIGENQSHGALDLGGRAPALLIARELLYRACELAMNINADPATEREIYAQFLAAIVEIAKTQQGAGSAALGAEPTPAPPAAATPNALIPDKKLKGHTAIRGKDNPDYGKDDDPDDAGKDR